MIAVEKRRVTFADYRALHRVADALEPRLKRALLEAVRSLQGSLDVQRLVELLRRGDASGLRAFWDAVELELGAAVAPTIRLGVLGSGMQVGRSMGLRFDLTNPQAVQAIDTHVALLVRGLTDEGRKAIQAVVRRGFVDGRTVEQMARDITTHVGLTERDAIAVSNYRRAQTAAGNPPGTVDTRAGQYALTLQRRRATVIARTETIRAANVGQDVAWLQARAEGLISPEARRVWIITPDDRLCPICEAIPDQNPEGVGLQEPFQSDEGPLMQPPAHPQCRCALGLSVPDA